MTYNLYPSQCDYIAQKTQINSTDFIDKCFPWINNKFFVNGLVFNTQNLINLEAQLYAVETLLRFLQVNPSVKIVTTDPTADDPYANLVRNVTVNNTIINISGSTPVTTADVSATENDLNANETTAAQPLPITPVPSGLSGSIINLSVSMIALVLILII
jgi:hypothetical protein